MFKPNNRTPLGYQNDLFCYVPLHYEDISMSELAQTGVTFDLAL
jgi:hypothetical protein